MADPRDDMTPEERAAYDEAMSGVDPEYHLKYDTNEMAAEQYAKLAVEKVRAPRTVNWNINSLVERIREEDDDPDARREKLARILGSLDQQQLSDLRFKWQFWARPNQIAPGGNWTFWMLLAGRGFGKTRTGAEWVLDRVEKGLAKRIALVAPTAADVRKVMVEGESGILAKAPPWNRPHFEPSKLQLTWPNGAIAQLFSAEEPERLRGPQCDTFWADELAAWKKLQETWDMLQFGFRLGNDPRGVITTTPKPVPLVKDLISNDRELPEAMRADDWLGHVAVTRGSTYDNVANLAPNFFAQVVRRYEGTRLGRQELEAAILEDMPGALWVRSNIDANRKTGTPPFPDIIKPLDVVTGERQTESMATLKAAARKILDAVGEDLSRITVNVDPNASNDEGSDEIGITCTAKGLSGRGYVLADASLKGSPSEWATAAILLHDAFGADRIIGEANQGGNMVEHTIASTAKFLRMEGKRGSDHVGITLVHATRGKVTRAEPVSALYEQNRVTHVGTMKTLEDQMCLFTSDFDRKSMGYSPDRVDSLVWGLTHLFLEGSDTGLLEFYQSEVLKQAAARAAKSDPGNFVRMKAPPGVSTAYGREGDRYDVKDGFVLVKPDDVAGLRLGRFEEIAA